jgi:exopolyphosphatase/guanosine-5'-triphosphate,3'-diphosphate pyrophosphatase
MDGQPPGAAAALDCGTNSTRLLITDSEGRTLTRVMRITRLGAGVDATHRLSQAAIDRTLAVLRDYRTLMDEAGVTRARLVTTSATRDAGNGGEFLQAASDVVGFPAELLSGEVEGRLAYAGATIGLPPVRGDDVVVDIGGGSTELVVQRAGSVHAVSLNLGCVRLSERYLIHDPPTVDEVDAMTEFIDTTLQGATVAQPLLANLESDSRLLGLAGTVSTLAALEQRLPVYDRDRIHHSILTLEAVARWSSDLAAEPAAQRALRPGMVDGRQDVIVGGAFVLRQVMRVLGFDSCLVSETDILDGLALSVLTPR